jgi:hypothetical protein
MSYPVIMNGDHAEFEREHADTPPRERSDWPLPSFDARDWAEAFCKIAKTKGHDIDEGWMTSWFANALMRGFDEHASASAICCADCGRHLSVPLKGPDYQMRRK